MRRSLMLQVRFLAGDRCDYCRMPASFDPTPFQVDHIIARQHGGETVLENLAWSCLRCNKFKGPYIAGIDPESMRLTALFHPRKQIWNRHFYWEGSWLVGRTRCARTTIALLAINTHDAVEFRDELMNEGVY